MGMLDEVEAVSEGGGPFHSSMTEEESTGQDSL